MTIKSHIPELISSDPRVTVGRFSYGNPRLLLWSEQERIQIGSFCSIADEVVISSGGEHRTDWVTTFPMRIAFGDSQAGKDGHPATKGETIIGHDVWIGFRAMILSGVVIGSGAVIGAGAVVTSDVPPYAIVAGNPANIIRYRFSSDEIQKLLLLRWWDWDDERIKKCIPLFCSTDTQRLINEGLLE
jgi:acetyltransferase-like isoleucine patch superfamily enzyme